MIVLEIFEKKSPKPCISMVLGPCDNRLYVQESGKSFTNTGHLGYIKLNSQCLNLILPFGRQLTICYNRIKIL